MKNALLSGTCTIIIIFFMYVTFSYLNLRSWILSNLEMVTVVVTVLAVVTGQYLRTKSAVKTRN